MKTNVMLKINSGHRQWMPTSSYKYMYIYLYACAGYTFERGRRAYDVTLRLRYTF